MFCTKCGKEISDEAVVCIGCGAPTANYNNQSQANTQAQPSIHIINTNANVAGQGKAINKWVAFVLCFFLGVFGAHKFYEGKTGMGILYIFTAGLCGIGVLVDLITILLKPDPYYV